MVRPRASSAVSAAPASTDRAGTTTSRCPATACRWTRTWDSAGTCSLWPTFTGGRGRAEEEADWTDRRRVDCRRPTPNHHHCGRNWIIIVAATGSKKNNTPIAGGANSTVATSATATSAPAATTKPGTAHVGATLSLSGSGGATAQVTLSQVNNPATGASGPPTDSSGNPNGDTYVATLMTIKNTSSSAIQGDANNDSTLIGSNNQSYSADFDSVNECTNFNSGSYQLAAGETAAGCVVFVMPPGVTPVKFHYSPDSGFSINFGEWLIP
jgi:hypothetical protein